MPTQVQEPSLAAVHSMDPVSPILDGDLNSLTSTEYGSLEPVVIIPVFVFL